MLVREGMSQTLLKLIPGNSDAFRAIICNTDPPTPATLGTCEDDPNCGVFMYTDKHDPSILKCPFQEAIATRLRSEAACSPLPVMLPYSVVILIYELAALGVMIQIKPAAGPKGEPEVVPLPLRI